MGVYIEGMEMPKDGDHPIWIALHSDGTVEYNANKGDGWQMTTAVSIPPHGRLIDADALKKQGYFLPCAIGTEYAIPLRAVREAPTIIPAEEASDV